MNETHFDHDNFFEVMDVYRQKFGEGIPFACVTDEGLKILLKEMKRAIKGERGRVGYSDIGIDISDTDTTI